MFIIYFNVFIYFLISVPIVLVGNKKDLHMNRVITQEEGHRLAETWKAVFLEASAKQNEVNSKKVSS
jgi:Ras family protein